MSVSFFFNPPATAQIYTLSLHDALPISWPPPASRARPHTNRGSARRWPPGSGNAARTTVPRRSEEHTSELQSPMYLVCRLLLEKKKKQTHATMASTHTKGTHKYNRDRKE